MIQYDEHLSLRGLLPGISNELYHAGPGVSSSDIKYLWQSTPLHWVTHKEAPPKPPTPAQVLGTAFHVAVLEPDLFETTYYVPEALPAVPEDVAHWRETRDLYRGELNMRTKADKAIFAEFLARHAADVGREEAFEKAVAAVKIRNQQRTGTCEEIKPEDRDRVLRMRDSALAHPRCRALLEAGAKVEDSIYWTDPVTGLLCKCRPDILVAEYGIMGDLKSSGSPVTKAGFAKAVGNFLYHVSAAHYLRGGQAIGMPTDVFLLIAVEADPPHGCQVFGLDDDALRLGAEICDHVLGQLACAIERDDWEPYPDQVQTLHLPNYSYIEVANRMATD